MGRFWRLIISLLLLSGCAKQPGFHASDYDYRRVSPDSTTALTSQKPSSPVRRTSNKIVFTPKESTWQKDELHMKADVKFGDKSFGEVEFRGTKTDSEILLNPVDQKLSENLKAQVICLNEGDGCDEFFIDVFYRENEKIYHDQIIPTLKPEKKAEMEGSFGSPATPVRQEAPTAKAKGDAVVTGVTSRPPPTTIPAQGKPGSYNPKSRQTVPSVPARPQEPAPTPALPAPAQAPTPPKVVPKPQPAPPTPVTPKPTPTTAAKPKAPAPPPVGQTPKPVQVTATTLPKTTPTPAPVTPKPQPAPTPVPTPPKVQPQAPSPVTPTIGKPKVTVQVGSPTTTTTTVPTAAKPSKKILDGDEGAETKPISYVGTSDEKAMKIFNMKDPSKSAEAQGSITPSATVKTPETDEQDATSIEFYKYRRLNQITGSPVRGRLKNATNFNLLSQIPGIHFFIVNPRDQDYFGSFDLAVVLKKLGEALQTFMPGKKLAVTSISRSNGGRLDPHSGHQNGTDADIRYLTNSDGRGDFVRNGRVSSDLLISNQWKLLKTAVESNLVEAIFVDRAIRRELCEEARRVHDYRSGDSNSIGAKVLAKIQSWEGHDDHFHVRAKCTQDNRACVPMPISPQRPGC